MLTILKVREELADGEDPVWYENPPGTVASRATPEELSRDGVEIPAAPLAAPAAPPHHDHVHR
jgi:hypothetical protein